MYPALNLTDYAMSAADQEVFHGGGSSDELGQLSKALEAGLITGRDTTNQLNASGSPPDPDLSVDMEGLMEDLALLGQDAGQEILKACEYDMKKDVSEDLDKQNFETDEDAEKKEDEIEEEEKDKEKEVEKDLTAGSESGRALQTESLDGELKDGRLS